MELREIIYKCIDSVTKASAAFKADCTGTATNHLFDVLDLLEKWLPSGRNHSPDPTPGTPGSEQAPTTEDAADAEPDAAAAAALEQPKVDV